MNNDVTTTGRFKVHDITFRNARSQSEVAKEQLKEVGVTNLDRPTPVPNSMTPEQLIKFFEECVSQEPDRAKLYMHTVKVIQEYDRLNKENRTLKAKIVRLENDNEKLRLGGESDSEDSTESDLG